MVRTEEGTLGFRGFRVWYRIVGDAPRRRIPLLLLHGGPGVPHDYLEPLEALAASGRRVVLYDQLGCGNSDRPRDPKMWSVDLFLDELATVRGALGLGEIHLFGHSWGGMLALEHALGGARGVASLVIASAPASMSQWTAEARRLRGELPPEVDRQLAACEAAGTTDDAAYVEAAMHYYRRHLCRLDPWPACLQRALTSMLEDSEVFTVMTGPSDFHVTGKLSTWDVTDRLAQVHVPTLVTSGRYDEATPEIARTVSAGIAGSEWTLFERSAHMPHLEERGRYLRVLERFLRSAEQAL